MKNLKKDVQALSKSLEEVSKRTERLIIKLEKLEKSPARPKARRTSAKGTASDAILAIIKRSRKGVDSVTLQKKTGFDNQKIRNNIYQLSNRGVIKRVSRGVYISAE